MNAATKYTLVWGCYSNTSMLTREQFEGAEGRKACWARVKELADIRFNKGWVGCESMTLAVLEVYATPPGQLTVKTTIKPHIPTSDTIRFHDKHGQGWAPYSATLSGITCG